MAVTRNITAMYRGPGRVVSRLFALGPREDRALAYLMAGCGLMFVAQMPKLARDAFVTGQELNMLMSSSLLAWVFIAPLIFYGLAALSYLVAKLLRKNADAYGTRLSLFWALLAVSPVTLLHGLVAGFVGPGAALDLVGLGWLAFFAWFWLGGLRATQGVRG